jgi:Trypsin-like peptidase domain
MPTIREATRHLVPLFHGESRRPSVCGTSTFIAIDRVRYLVTAAHVLDENEAIHFGHGIITGPTTGRVVSTSIPPGGTRANDRLDVAVLRLADEQADRLVAIGREPISVPVWNADDQHTPGQTYVFSGYPASRAEFNRRERTVDLGPMSAKCVVEGEPAFGRAGVDPRTHIVAQFDRRRMMGQEGRQVTAPGPWGMSGGPVWTARPDSDELALVGIGIEYLERQNVLVGTRIGAAIALLRASDPETCSTLPTPRFFTVSTA